MGWAIHRKGGFINTSEYMDALHTIWSLVSEAVMLFKGIRDGGDAKKVEDAEMVGRWEKKRKRGQVPHTTLPVLFRLALSFS